MKGKKIYIAGGITGVPDYKEHFAKAEEYLISRGAIPMNPARMSEGFEWKDYLHICLTMIDVCEAVFLLKWVLFEAIGHHLKQEHALKRQTLWLLLPISLLAAYCVFYFVA